MGWSDEKMKAFYADARQLADKYNSKIALHVADHDDPEGGATVVDTGCDHHGCAVRLLAESLEALAAAQMDIIQNAAEKSQRGTVNVSSHH